MLPARAPLWHGRTAELRPAGVKAFRVREPAAPDAATVAVVPGGQFQRQVPLAGALAAVPVSPRNDPVRQQLAADPRFSVRSALYKAEQGSTLTHRRPGEPV